MFANALPSEHIDMNGAGSRDRPPVSVVFLLGASASAISFVIARIWNDGDILIASAEVGQLAQLVEYAAAGAALVALAFGLSRLPGPGGITSWSIRIIAAGALLPLITNVLRTLLRAALLGESAPPLSDLGTWSGLQYLDFDYVPKSVIPFFFGAVLAGLIIDRPSVPLKLGGSRDWTPGPPFGTGAEEVTRILCGNAVLSGRSFRRTVLTFFENKWIATAPEFGLDIRLLASVCSYADARDSTYQLGLAAIGTFGAVIAATQPDSVAVVAPIIIIISGSLWFKKQREALATARMFTHASFSPTSVVEQFRHELDRDVRYALPREDQNVIVYSGFVPFVGAGLDLGGWSFTTFVDKPKIKGRSSTIRPFAVPELYAALEAGLASLRLATLRCRDYAFVRGLDIKGDRQLLSDLAFRPKQTISAEMMAQLVDGQDTRVRNYKCVQVIDWGGEVIVSYFLRCVLQGTSLFVEMRRYLLPPLADRYRRVDRLGRDRFALRVGQFLASLTIGPLMAVIAPFIVLAAGQEALAKALSNPERQARRRRRAAEDNPAYDYGAATTLRASFAPNQFPHYFQKTDADFDKKVIERKILDEIERFLDESGIDTTDIRDRQMTILNSGILVQGGDVRAESLAVGEGAQATKVESQKAAQPRETVG